MRKECKTRRGDCRSPERRKKEADGQPRMQLEDILPEAVRDEPLHLVPVRRERAQADLSHDARSTVSLLRMRISVKLSEALPPRTCSAFPMIMCGSLSIHSFGTSVSFLAYVRMVKTSARVIRGVT